MREPSQLLTRREALIVVGLFGSGSTPAAVSSSVFSPEAFGAVGNGVHDDWPALAALARAVNQAGGGRINFAMGRTYHFGRHITLGSEGNFSFEHCDPLVISGNGAKIDIQGEFDRASADVFAFSGLIINNCSNVTIENLEIDGNNDEMSNLSGSKEPPSHGIRIGACRNILLRDLRIHHHSGDGILLRDAGPVGGRRANRLLVAERVRCLYNSRQGMSVTALRGGRFVDCEFSYTGRTSGYGGHSPQSGVDIEPDRDTHDTGSNKMDVDTGELVFLNCRFQENNGSQFLCGGIKRYNGIVVKSCDMVVGTGSRSGRDALVFGAADSLLEDCEIDIGGDPTQLFYLWPNPGNADGSFTLRRNRIRGAGELLRTNGTERASILIEENEFTHMAAGPYRGFAWRLVGSPKLVMRQNELFAPRPAFIPGKGGRPHVIALMHGALAENNLFVTDMVSAGKAAAFAVEYGPHTRTAGERYKGAFRGIGGRG